MTETNHDFIEGKDFYNNDAGLMVLTEKYHLERGYCCGNGCLHCPYNYVNVPEPARAKLLSKRQKENP
jgi:hypothetical protein